MSLIQSTDPQAGESIMTTSAMSMAVGGAKKSRNLSYFVHCAVSYLNTYSFETLQNSFLKL